MKASVLFGLGVLFCFSTTSHAACVNFAKVLVSGEVDSSKLQEGFLIEDQGWADCRSEQGAFYIDRYIPKSPMSNMRPPNLTAASIVATYNGQTTVQGRLDSEIIQTTSASMSGLMSYQTSGMALKGQTGLAQFEMSVSVAPNGDQNWRFRLYDNGKVIRDRTVTAVAPDYAQVSIFNP